jgi:hypothetical protein
MPPLPVPTPSRPTSYWATSRAPRYSLLFALPLLLLYEVLAAVLSPAATGGVRNGADVLIKGLFSAAAGVHGPLVFGVVLIAGCLWLVGRDVRSGGGGLRARVFAGMAAESVALALACGVIVGTITARLLDVVPHLAVPSLTLQPMQQLGWWTQLMISLGAGLYEELLFRVLLVAGLGLLGRRVLGWSTLTAGAVATVVGAFIFSAFHYVGAYGDPFEIQSFTFRFIAGLFFSALYLLRGFGITAWTHALYDVFLVLAGQG